MIITIATSFEGLRTAIRREVHGLIQAATADLIIVLQNVETDAPLIEAVEHQIALWEQV